MVDLQDRQDQGCGAQGQRCRSLLPARSQRREDPVQAQGRQDGQAEVPQEKKAVGPMEAQERWNEPGQQLVGGGDLAAGMLDSSKGVLSDADYRLVSTFLAEISTECCSGVGGNAINDLKALVGSYGSIVMSLLGSYR